MAVPTIKVYHSHHDKTFLSELHVSRTADDSYCDVVLEVDGVEFKAHKIVLGRLSKFFDRMFKTDMKEKYDSFAHVKGINATTMKSLLDFLYTATLEISNDNVMDLLSASHYFLLHEATEFCIDYVISSLNSNNCMQMRLAGILYDVPVLTDKAEKIIVEHIGEVTQSNEFYELSKSDVQSIVKLLNKNTTNSVKSAYEATVAWVQHSLEERKKHFPEMIKDVKLHLLPKDYIENVVMAEDLIKEFKLVKALLNGLFWQSVVENHFQTKQQFVVLEKTKVKLFKVFTRQWKDLPDLPHDCSRACVAAHKGILYVIGCENKQILKLNLLACNSSWEIIGETIKIRHNSKAVYFQNFILVIGENISFNSSYSALEVNRLRSAFQLAESNAIYSKDSLKSLKETVSKGGTLSWFRMPSSSYEPQSQPIRNDISMCSAEKYHPVKGLGFEVAPLRFRNNPSLLTCQERVYVIGGDDGNTIEAYQGDKWEVVNSEATVHGGGAVMLDNKIFCIAPGGLVQSFSLKHKMWLKEENHNCKYDACDAFELYGDVYLFGKAGNQFVLQKYSIKLDSWSTVHTEKCGDSCMLIAAI